MTDTTASAPAGARHHQRRRLLRAAGAVALAAPAITLGRKAWSAAPLKKLTFA